MNQLGGKWTVEKLEILETYARQYLKVFKNNSISSLLYFDGFAGSGDISISKGDRNERTEIEGSAVRILSLDDPRSFDIYYFVEKDKSFAQSLESRLKREFPNKRTFVLDEDCNQKLKDMSKFLRSPKGSKIKVLGFIDPKGMQLEWEALESLAGLSIDLWILNPTSGTNRLLKRKGDINEAWLKRLEIFLGMPKDEVLKYFYQESKQQSLFGRTEIVKQRDSINRLHNLYSERIRGNIFKYVSEPRVLRDSKNHILFHFFMVTNNEIGLKIANSVVNPKIQKL
ncbi:MAG: three-Cys-motif partner protein TcmP [Cyclobacteriaceae bacterium]